MDWDKEEQRYKQSEPILHLKSYDIKVMKIKSREGERIVENTCDFASKKYLKTSRKKRGNEYKYKMYLLKVFAVHWPLQDQDQMYDGFDVKTEMSKKVYDGIILLRMQIKRYGYEPPEYLLYWKRNFNMVWYALVPESRLMTLTTFIKKFDNQDKDKVIHMKKCVCWSGNKAAFRLKRFRQFYDNELYDHWYNETIKGDDINDRTNEMVL